MVHGEVHQPLTAESPTNKQSFILFGEHMSILFSIWEICVLQAYNCMKSTFYFETPQIYKHTISFMQGSINGLGSDTIKSEKPDTVLTF